MKIHPMTKSFLTKSLIALSCLLALTLSACAPVVVAAGGAAVAAGTTEKGLATSINDSLIHTKISETYFKDDLGLYGDVNIEVNQGSVLLTGAVQNQEDVSNAVGLAWQVHGVVEVIDEIDVRDKPAFKDRAKDFAASAELRTRLITDADVHSLNFSIDVVSGVIYLSGIAQSEDEMNKVIAHAQSLRFGTEVVNYIRINDDQR